MARTLRATRRTQSGKRVQGVRRHKVASKGRKGSVRLNGHTSTHVNGTSHAHVNGHVLNGNGHGNGYGKLNGTSRASLSAPIGPHIDPPFEPSGPLAERLTHAERERMRAFFTCILAKSFAAECWIFLSRELRVRPRYRDYQGIADLMTIARLRGLAIAFEWATDRVEYEVWADIELPDVAKVRPAWEHDKGADYPKRMFRVRKKANSKSYGKEKAARGGKRCGPRERGGWNDE